MAAQATRAMVVVFKEAIDIADGTSKLIGAGKGIEAATGHLFSNIKSPPPKDNDALPVSLGCATPWLEAAITRRRANPVPYGVTTGYDFIDNATGGIRKKSLYLHAGFAGHLKTTQMLNMIVNAALLGWNSILFTSEMPAAEVMMTLGTIHSADPKFSPRQPLSQYPLLLGNVDDTEVQFFHDVMHDLTTNPGHGSIRVVDSAHFSTFGSIKQRVAQEDEQTKGGIDVCWIDYLTRLPLDPPARNARFMTNIEAKNELIAEAKRWAMSFRKGEGLAVCSPFQVNREGFKNAKENGGLMDETCLALYSAAEREADVITYIWYGPEEQKMQQPIGGFIKNRWGGLPNATTTLSINSASRKIFEGGGLPVLTAPVAPDVLI